MLILIRKKIKFDLKILIWIQNNIFINKFMNENSVLQFV